MVEATNFVEKELGKTLDGKENLEPTPESKQTVPIYTPPPPPIQEPLPPEPQIIQQPVIQIVEKIVYKKQRIHGFFRTLTIITLLAIGFLMFGESTGLITFSINSFKLHQIFPLFIILSTIIIRSYKGIFGKIFWLIIFLTVWWWLFTLSVYTSLNPSSKRKSGEIIDYKLSSSNNKTNNLYIETLIGNSYIEWSGTNTNVQWIRNSDRNLLISSWYEKTSTYLKLNEDTNRNILQDHASNIDLTIPKDEIIDLLYLKNFLWLHTIDLTNIQWKTLKFHAGIDDITIKLWNILSGNKIEIQWAAANVDIDIPNDVGVMMYYKHLVGVLKTPEFDALSGHYFQSKNIATAKTTLNIYVNLGAGNTKINRVEPK